MTTDSRRPGSEPEPGGDSNSRGGDRGIHHVDARLQHLADGARTPDSPLEPAAVALELERLAAGYRNTPDETLQTAGSGSTPGVDVDVAEEIAACYQYVDVDNQRFARRLEAAADGLRRAGSDDAGGGG